MADALVGPVAIAPVSLGMLLGTVVGRAGAGCGDVLGDPLPAMRISWSQRDALLDLLADQLVRHVEYCLAIRRDNLRADAAALPLGILVAIGGQ